MQLQRPNIAFQCSIRKVRKRVKYLNVVFIYIWSKAVIYLEVLLTVHSQLPHALLVSSYSWSSYMCVKVKVICVLRSNVCIQASPCLQQQIKPCSYAQNISLKCQIVYQKTSLTHCFPFVYNVWPIQKRAYKEFPGSEVCHRRVEDESLINGEVHTCVYSETIWPFIK